MMHFSCDLCGKSLVPGDDHRYVVKIEAYAAQDPAEITDADLDEDHMEAVSQLLRDMEESMEDADVDQPCQNFRFDLCPECLEHFVRDPLGKEQTHKMFFSKN